MDYSDYKITVEKFSETYSFLEPLYRMHYAEMQSRLLSDGVKIPDYDPRLDVFTKAGDEGWLKTFVLRFKDEVVGYSNMYITNDMHNREKIAKEDTIYVKKEHRNGIGKKLVVFIQNYMKEAGVKRINISPVTDLRVGKIWKRMGYKPVAEHMTLELA
jgi:GNAT superfamily N-acetyltransferase